MLRLIRRIPGHRGLMIVAMAAALALGGVAMNSTHTPPASAQCFGCSPFFNNGFGFNGFFNNGFGFNGFNNFGFSNFCSFGNFGCGFNSCAFNTFNCGLNTFGCSPFTTVACGFGGSFTPGVNVNLTTIPTTTVATVPATTVVTTPAPNYSVGGNYCNLKNGGQVWVPSGASPAAYGC
jgi:hypothetical protein